MQQVNLVTVPPLPATFKLAIIRHGQTTANLEGRFSGESEVSLTLNGLEMASAAAASPLLTHTQHIFCSPQERALDTAQIIARRRALPSPTSDDGFRELHFGDWEGHHPADVNQTIAHQTWLRNPLIFAPPNGEAGLLVLNRAYLALCRALSAVPNCAIVTHKSPARLLTAFLTQQDLQRFRDMSGFFVSSITYIEMQDGRLVQHIPANVDHLPIAWQSDPDRLPS